MPNGRFLWTAHAIKLNVIERALIKYALFRALENALDWRLARGVIILNNTETKSVGQLCFDAEE